MDSISQPVVAQKNPEYEKWYKRRHWRMLRTLVLARDPICMMCKRNAATVADHIKPHRGIWELFSALLNLQGLCHECHSRKTAAEDGGLGNAPRAAGVRSETNEATITGGTGKQFQSSTVDSKKIDAALVLGVDFLKDIPE